MENILTEERASLTTTPKPLTLEDAQKIVRTLGLRLTRTEDFEYRVNFPHDHVSTAYFTDELEDAVGTARLMKQLGDSSFAARLKKVETNAKRHVEIRDRLKDINDAIKAGASPKPFIKEQFKLAIELESLDNQARAGI